MPWATSAISVSMSVFEKDDFCDLLDAEDFALIERVRERSSIASAPLDLPYVRNYVPASASVQACSLPRRHYEPEWRTEERLQPIRLAARRKAKQRKRQEHVERRRLEQLRVEAKAAKKAARKLATQRTKQHEAAVDAFLREKQARKRIACESVENAIREHAALMARERQAEAVRLEARRRAEAEVFEPRQRAIQDAAFRFQLFERQQEVAHKLLEQVPMYRLTAIPGQFPYPWEWPLLKPGEVFFFHSHAFIHNQDLGKARHLRGRLAFVEQHDNVIRYVAVGGEFTLYDKILAVVAIAGGSICALSNDKNDLMTKTGCTDPDELQCHITQLAKAGYLTIRQLEEGYHAR